MSIVPSKTIKYRVPDSDDVVPIKSEDYVKAKTKALREFGYNNLTEDEVREQLGMVLHGGKLTVIGRFIEGDIVK